MVLLDESQDSNDITLELFNKFNAKKIMVGDVYQKIYGFRGSINGMEKFKADKVLHLTYTFRFDSEDEVKLVNDYLKYCKGEKDKYLIKPFGKKDDKKIDNEETLCYLCRTNARVLEILEKKDLKTVRHPDNFFKNIFLLLSRKYKIGFGEVNESNLYTYLEDVIKVAEIIGDRDVIASANLIIKVIRKGESPYEYFNDLKEKAVSLYYSNIMKFIGTAHSCKGLEFDKVIVADDFPTIEDLIVNLYKKGKLVGYIEGNKFIVKKEGLFDVFRNGSNSVREELNLLYVAFTRFKKEVEIPNIYKLKDEYVVELPMEEECIGSFIDEREIDDSLEYLHI